MRLLFSNIMEDAEEQYLKKAELLRVPLRLGADAFTNKRISQENIEKLVNTMKAFRHLIDVFNVIDYRACATSAMREAANGPAIVKRIADEAGIKIKIVDGKKEAEIIYSTHIAEHMDRRKTYLYTDVGGGSTELTFFSGGKIVNSYSFNIGTIRILNDQVKEKDWKAMRHWIKENTGQFSDISGIGSGGNINKIFKMSRKREGAPLSYKELWEMHDNLSQYSSTEKINELGMRPDRADVIVPAATIFLKIMKWSGMKNIYVPQIGLADGIVHLLFQQYKKDKKKRKNLFLHAI